MTVQGVGFIPAAPLLIPEVVGAGVDRDADLRDTVRGVVRDVVTIQEQTGSRIAVIGAAPTSGEVEDAGDFRRLGIPGRDGAQGARARSLAIGAWFLDEQGTAGPRIYLGVATDAPTAECEQLAGSLEGDVVILVVGDGSACHGDKAPGREDARARQVDDAIATAMGAGAPGGLLSLDAGLCRDLLVEGRAPWQVAAAAALPESWHGDLRLVDHRYGVGYLAGLWSRTTRE